MTFIDPNEQTPESKAQGKKALAIAAIVAAVVCFITLYVYGVL